jgi:putative hydrolase of the HAD superfamily
MAKIRDPSAPPIELANVESWVFDLDNTVYPADVALFRQVEGRIGEFVAGLLEVSLEEARVVQQGYLRDYGTTLRGLMTKHGVEPGPYLDFVEQIDLSPLPSGEALNAALEALPGRKLIYTNATRYHADRVLDQMGISDHFEGIYGIIDADYVPKPEMASFNDFIARFGVDPKKSVMFEDMARNLQPASELGMTTVWVTGSPDWASDDKDDQYIDHVTADLPAFLQTLVPGSTDG